MNTTLKNLLEFVAITFLFEKTQIETCKYVLQQNRYLLGESNSTEGCVR
jgi:hypothetical protein